MQALLIKMQNLRVPSWVALILTLVIVILILMWPSPQEPNTQMWKDTIAAKEQALQELRKERADIALRLKADSLGAVKQKKTYDSTISRQKSRISDLQKNPVIIRIRDEVPEVDSIIVAYDSAILVRDHRILALEHSYNKLQVNMQAITLNFESQLQLERQRFEASQSQLAAQEKENRKVKRSNKLLKILLPVAAVGGFLLGGL